jgi:acetyl-CoA acyltransferase 1
MCVRAAIKDKLFTEIIPVHAKVTDKDGNEKTVTVTQGTSSLSVSIYASMTDCSRMVVGADEGPRAGTTLESLARLPSAFKEGGSSTAGNSSQVSDCLPLCAPTVCVHAQRHVD